MKQQIEESPSTDVSKNILAQALSPESDSRSIEETRRVTTRHAAELLGIAESTLRKWRMGGNGPRFIKMGSRVLYDTGELEHWLERRSRTTTMSSYRAPSRFQKLKCTSTSVELSAYGAGELND